MSDLIFVHPRLEHVEAMERIELISFPGHDPEELFSVAELTVIVERFPEGGFVALDNGVVVGQGLGIFVDWDEASPQHTFEELCGADGISGHRKDGEWYYGTDIAVDPAHRGRRIGIRLYELRKDIVVRYNRKGIVAGGVLPGYADHKEQMTALEYVRAVERGDLTDPTLSFQLSQDFELLGTLTDYLGPGDDASLIVWRNPWYQRA